MKVLLVDDHPLFLDGLQDLLVSHGIEVLGTAHDGREAIEKARSLRPEIILMDIRMPHVDGLAGLRQIKTELPAVKVVMLTTSSEDNDLFEAIRSGACGYLLKTQPAEELLGFMREIEQGEVALSPGLAGRILQEFARQSESVKPPRSLSPREQEVLTLVAQGMKYKEVAAKLFVSERTIKFHMGEIIERLHLKNRAQAVEYARRTGLVE